MPYKPRYKRRRWPYIILRLPWVLLGVVVCIALLHFVPSFYRTLEPVWPRIAIPSASNEPLPIDRVIFERDIFNYVNEMRELAGVSPTKWDETLYIKSQDICGLMAANRYLCHHDWRSPWNENCYGGGFSYSSYNEHSVSVEGIVGAWLDSPPHCRILLSEEIKHSAVGVSFENGFWVAWSFPRYGEPVGYSPWLSSDN